MAFIHRTGWHFLHMTETTISIVQRTVQLDLLARCYFKNKEEPNKNEGASVATTLNEPSHGKTNNLVFEQV